jgi:haloalkane dehalogenase
MNTVAFSQSWVDTTLYPFDHKYLELESGYMHYVDEGQGEVILFVHGTPTWSFLYRDFISTLSKDHRCIAIDHLGFGLSEHPDQLTGTPEWHADKLLEFIEQLDLKDITLVVHDFGGPIGLAAGIAHPDRIKRVVLFNTWLWSLEQNKDARRVDKLVNCWLGRFLYLNMNISPKVLLKRGFSDKSKLPKEIHDQYLKPFPDKNSRKPLLELAKALVGSSEWYQKQWQQLHRLSDKEWLILWGKEDNFIKQEFLKQWQERIEQATIKEYDCGHFVQEERTEEAIKAIRQFMK